LIPISRASLHASVPGCVNTPDSRQLLANSSACSETFDLRQSRRVLQPKSQTISTPRYERKRINPQYRAIGEQLMVRACLPDYPRTGIRKVEDTEAT
jgi:hypothetical protein